MPISGRELFAGAGCCIVHTGIVTGQEIIEYNDHCLRHPEKLQQLKFILATFAHTEAIRISEREAQAIGQQYFMMGQHIAQGVVAALVAADNGLFAIARIWEERINGECCQAAAFRKLSDAEVWICQKMRENFGWEVEGLGL